jgi:transporter family-2 protein
MLTLKSFVFSGLGILTGGLIAVQSVLNSSLGQRIGNLGSVLVLTFISVVVLVALIFAVPSTADLNNLPRLSEWYLYFGGVMGVAILAIPIYLVPKIGTASTLIAIVLGQSMFALLIDHFGLLASPRIEVNLARGIGVFLVAVGAYLVGI